MRNLIIFLGLWSASVFATDFPMIIDPVVSATPPGAKVTAGYLTLVNESDKDIIINGAYSPTIAKVEIHLSRIKNDVASMEKLDSVTVKSGEKLEFKHGSYHLMLMELTGPLKENDLVDVILSTSIGDMLIEMPVKKPGMHTEGSSHGEMSKDDKAKMAIESHENMKKDGDMHTGQTKTVH